MDVKWNSIFHIELPQIERDSITISISAMIHDVDAGVSAIENTLQTADMTPFPRYSFPNALSMVYGVMNSIVSVLDSISDLYFVFLVLSAEGNAAITTLAIGNLVASALGMSIFLVKDVRDDYLKGLKSLFGFFLLFAVLSPVMPALVWLFDRVRNATKAFVIDASSDELLTWHRTELVKNRLFIFETAFESCFQALLQFAAVFLMEELGSQTIYLWISIFISITVILSKFSLFAYNLRRSVMLLSILSFFLDICSCLLLSTFIAGFLYQDIFTFIGLYMTVEMLLWIPVCVKMAIDEHPLVSALDDVGFGCCFWLLLLLLSICSISCLALFWYPVSICVFPFFSIYPFRIKMLTRPDGIGRNQVLHEKLFEYCLDASDDKEFKQKIFLINHVCIKMCFDRLKRSDSPQWYRLAKRVRDWNPRLRASRFNTVCEMAQLQEEIPLIVQMKSYQGVMRVIGLSFALIMDLIIGNTLSVHSPFVDSYGHVLTSVGPFLCLVLLLWIGLFVKDAFGNGSKWHMFSRLMVCTKHKDFFLAASVETIIRRCDQFIAESKTVKPALLQLTDKQTRSTVVSNQYPMRQTVLTPVGRVWLVSMFTFQVLIFAIFVVFSFGGLNHDANQ